MTRRFELLAPAGGMESLRAALRFGADAVYLGGPMLQLRAGSAGFDMDGVARAAEIAHERDCRLYVAVNAFANESDIAALDDYARALSDAGIDGVIASDLGVIARLRERAPELPVHVSTQANCLNSAAARAYSAMGVRRIVLGREMTLDQIRALRDAVPDDLELEAFVHGAMCMAYSGRCLISAYLTGRSANRGDCTQPCRWNYHLMEETRPGEFFPVEEDERGTSILSSFDLNCLGFLNQLMDAGVTSFKIEGRMKSAYYVATVVNAYRRRIDAIFDGTAAPEHTALLQRELDCVSHRPYASGFYFGEMKLHAPAEGTYLQGAVFAGIVTAAANGRIEMELRNRVRAGERLELVSPDSLGESFVVREIRNMAGEALPEAAVPGRIYVMDCDCPAKPGDLLRRKMEK